MKRETKNGNEWKKKGGQVCLVVLLSSSQKSRVSLEYANVWHVKERAQLSGYSPQIWPLFPPERATIGRLEVTR